MPHRREFLSYLGALAMAPAAGLGTNEDGGRGTAPTAFESLPHDVDKTHHVAAGYRADVLLRWGDVLTGPDWQRWDPARLNRTEQARRFGYNNDFIAYLPLPVGSTNSTHGLLCVNHEYTNTSFMWPALSPRTIRQKMDADRTATEIAAIGHSVVEVKKDGHEWRAIDGPFNRRYTGFSRCALQGPVRGDARVSTSGSPDGTSADGILNPCSGGKTPWGTVLIAEENFNFLFSGTDRKDRESINHQRYGIGSRDYYSWWADHFARFDAAKHPREPNGFGWVIEIDPYNPRAVPKKRTALGRFKHEAATCALNPDGRVVVYSGDDGIFEYLYKFVSRRPFDAKNRAANVDLLDDGDLYVARFYDDGTLEWRRVEFGHGPLTPDHGFHSQADVLIETRRAADLLEATRLDRPEDVEANPHDGIVYAMLTNNTARDQGEVDAANPRAQNRFGHILKLLPPGAPGPTAEHASTTFRWSQFVLAGDPENANHGARYPGTTADGGWFACPDNCAFDPSGRLWIASDQGAGWRTTGIADGLWCYAPDVGGDYGFKRFFQAPIGAEVCGPEFTPDGRTLFLSVQHPGVDGIESAGYHTPATRWPDFAADLPPRPSVVAITHAEGKLIGS